MVLTAAAAIVRKTTTAERGAKEFHPRSLPFVSLSPLLSSPLLSSPLPPSGLFLRPLRGEDLRGRVLPI